MISKLMNKLEAILALRKRKLFYSRLINTQDIVFDIGANHGDRTSVFLDIGAKVIAVEPNPMLATRLNKKFSKKIHVIQKAVGDKNGVIDLFINDSDVLTTTSLKWIDNVKKSGRFGDLADKFNHKIEVEMLTLDDLISIHKTPKFIKIDVEGLELEIIKTIKNSSIESLSFEFAIPETLEDTLNALIHLNNVGYDFYNISFGESMEFLTNKNLSFTEITNLLKHLPVMSWGDIYVFSKNKKEKI